MADIVFKVPSQVADEYLQHLKSLRPDVNINQTDSDWYVRSRVIGGTLSGAYGDAKKIASDAFPQAARREALERHLNMLFGTGFKTATQSEGNVQVTGTIGSLVPAGTEFLYAPNGNTYTSQSAVTLAATAADLPVKSVASGQTQNILVGASLLLTTPPAGIDPTATVLAGGIGNGKNDETNEEAADRILSRYRNPPSGGTVTDYQAWASEADNSVTDVNVIRFIYGPGTVALVVAAGTSDIDSAVTNGNPVIRVPTDSLIQRVREYVNAKKPITDCVFYLKAVETPIDVTFNVKFVTGDGATIPAGSTLTQAQLVEREIKRAIYKTPPGGRRIGGKGYVLASEVEEVIDQGLSALPYTVGNFAAIIVDRQCGDLSATGVNREISELEIAIPGTITINVL